MNVNYADVVFGSQLYCAVDIIRKKNDIYYHMLLIRWFGEYSSHVPAARGEMVALAAIHPKFRNEIVTISPKVHNNVDSHLTEWRAKYKYVQYSDTDKSIDDLLRSEVSIIHDSKDRLILSKIMAKNLPQVLFCPDDRGVSAVLGTEELPVDKVVLCLVSQSESGEFKIIGFRRATSKKHLQEIIKQSNDHNLIIYYSPFTVDNSEIVAEGPWILLPASLRSFSPNKEVVNQPLVFAGDPVESPTIQTVQAEDNTTQNDELVIDYDGLACPYCEKKLKSTFGLSNHINHKHPDKKDEYERAYKA